MWALNEPVVAEATLLVSNGDTISGVGQPRSRGTSANGGKRLHEFGVGTSRSCLGLGNPAILPGGAGQINSNWSNIFQPKGPKKDLKDLKKDLKDLKDLKIRRGS